MMKNQPERQLHKAVAEYLTLSLPSNAVWFPVPSASRRGPAQAANMKRAGELMVGIPDIILVYHGRLIGLELKAPKGRLSPSQREFHDRLMLSGAVVHVVRSLNELYEFLCQIIPLKVRPQ
jgi:hypothetical protein